MGPRLRAADPRSKRRADEKRRAVLRAAIDAGIAELDGGFGVECTPDELMAEVYAEVGLDSA